VDFFFFFFKKKKKKVGKNSRLVYKFRFKFDLLQTKPQADCHMGHPLIHHRTFAGTEHMHFLSHSWNQAANTLHEKQLLGC
jgi:hypothetical protein